MKEFLRVIKFTLFSISAGIIQMGAFEILDKIVKVPNWWVCNVTAIILSVIWNFTFNRKFTFKSAANVKIAMLKVLLFYAVFIPATAIPGEILVKDYSWNRDLVQILTMLLNLVTEFLFQRFFVFNKNIDDANK